jgi:RNA polymerase sigma-70 factor (ECF subfamily)
MAMAEDASFHELMAKVRGGDAEAAAELVRRYEGAVRRAVRFRITDTRLQASLDSMDICQSVLGSFFVRAAAGQYDLRQPEQLTRLLLTMARNKLASHARQQRAECRDVRRQAGELNAHELVNPADAPSRQVAAKELLAEAQRLLSAEERQLMERRQQGRDWESIAAELGGKASVLRKQLSRALGRIARALGLDDLPDD